MTDFLEHSINRSAPEWRFCDLKIKAILFQFKSNPNFICWHPLGTKKVRYWHYFNRFRQLQRFVDWTVSGRGFTVSNFTNWHEGIQRNFYWISQDNHWPKFIPWPTRKVLDNGEVVFEEHTLNPHHYPMTDFVSSFKPMQVEWKYYDDPRYVWEWRGEPYPLTK